MKFFPSGSAASYLVCNICPDADSSVAFEFVSQVEPVSIVQFCMLDSVGKVFP